jgi:hypothetical protein
MKQREFHRMQQSRIARGAVGATAVRGRGNAGTVHAARAFLRKVNLKTFSTSQPTKFAAALNRTTDALRASLPNTARHWGVARKVLNLFLRDCLYNKYLNEAYSLDRASRLLELPLDSYTGKALVDLARGTLPRWPGVKHVTTETSAAFQLVAALEGKRRELDRVHLDGLWWSVDRDKLEMRVTKRRGK